LQSIEFHEKGKRHKENAAKRLAEIGKKSRQEHQKNLKVDVEMKKMEEVRLNHANITQASGSFHAPPTYELHALLCSLSDYFTNCR
jgi:hypothetical protein